VDNLGIEARFSFFINELQSINVVLLVFVKVKAGS